MEMQSGARLNGSSEKLLTKHLASKYPGVAKAFKTKRNGPKATR